MEVSNEDKIRLINSAINDMSMIGYRLDKLLTGFKLYHERKGTLDIVEYEKVLEVFTKAIAGMEEQLQTYHRLFTYVQAIMDAE